MNDLEKLKKAFRKELLAILEEDEIDNIANDIFADESKDKEEEPTIKSKEKSLDSDKETPEYARTWKQWLHTKGMREVGDSVIESIDKGYKENVSEQLYTDDYFDFFDEVVKLLPTELKKFVK